MLQQRNLKTREEQHGEICKFVSKANDGWKRFDWSDLLIECKPGFCSYILSEEQRARRNERHGIPRPLLTIRNIYTALGRGEGGKSSLPGHLAYKICFVCQINSVFYCEFL